MSAHEQKPIVFEEEHAAPSSVVTTTLTFIFLAFLTGFATVVGFTDLGPAKVWVSLGIAVTQATILVLFFMDLRNGDTITWLTAIGALFWTFLLFLFTLTDYLTRHYAAL